MNTKLLFTTACCCCLLVVCVFTSCSIVPDTPPYAASTKTWKIGKQVWSDAIQVPECHKTSFTMSVDPDDIGRNRTKYCRAYTDGKKTWYYYNWAYVFRYAEILCPHPWRVPSGRDIAQLECDGPFVEDLIEWANGEMVVPEFACISRWDQCISGAYWADCLADREAAAWAVMITSDKTPSRATTRDEWSYSNVHAYDTRISHGLQVRCVRD